MKVSDLSFYINFHDKIQSELSEIHIKPNLDEIYSVFLGIRREVDEIVFKKKLFYPNKPNYPEGYCGEIRDITSSLIKDKKNDVKSPINIIKRLEKKGILLKDVYGIQHGKYFQNAIQLGNYLVDVANDTVDINKEKIEISSLYSSGMENFESYEQYSSVAEQYWGVDIFPNVYFPFLSTIFPLIFLEEDGRITFTGQSKQLGFMDGVFNDFSLSSKFLNESKYSAKKLDKKYLDKLSESFFYNNGLESFINNFDLAKKDINLELTKGAFGKGFGKAMISYNFEKLNKIRIDINKQLNK